MKITNECPAVGVECEYRSHGCEWVLCEIMYKSPISFVIRTGGIEKYLLNGDCEFKIEPSEDELVKKACSDIGLIFSDGTIASKTVRAMIKSRIPIKLKLSLSAD